MALPTGPVEYNALAMKLEIMDSEHGSLTAHLHTKYCLGDQSFGGYSLFNRENPGYTRLNTCGLFLDECFRILDVSNLKDIPGKALRIRVESGLITAIGHWYKDDWFAPKKAFEKFDLEHSDDPYAP